MSDYASSRDEVAESDLSPEQKKTLELLNGHMADILVEFNAVLARHGIQREVHEFSTRKVGTTDFGAGSTCMMACCACPPPEEACIGQCSACPEGGAPGGPVALGQE